MAIGGRIMVILALILIVTNNTVANQTANVATTSSQDPESVTELCSNSQQWFCFNSTTKTHNCIDGYSYITCSDSGPLLKLGHCATYSEDMGLVTITKCPYFRVQGHNMSTSGSAIQLPKTLTDLNDFMCGPMNRKGIVCSECIDGFGPSVTSFGYTCANCTNVWYRVPLFLILIFAPITVFYLFILIFQISLTSPPMPCFIMYAQMAVIELYRVDVKNFSARVILTESGDLGVDAKIILTLYELFNLDFFHYILPPFCVNSQIKPIHIVFLGYFSVLYPILLIFLTWLCVELHGYNFQSIVWLWRPFHKCCVKLRRGWDNKNDIIDVFATFFFLSYHKCLYQSVLLISPQHLWNFNSTVMGQPALVSKTARSVADLSITAGNLQHICYAVTAGIVIVLFYILPTLLLVLYPIKSFRRLLSKCHLDFIALNIFIDKIHKDYRNGLNGGRDMRSLSGLYFILRVVIIICTACHIHKIYHDAYAVGCGILLGCALVVAWLKPYRNDYPYMNYLDTVLLANYVLIWYVISSGLDFSIILIKLLLTLPMAIFILGIVLKLRMSNSNHKNQAKIFYCYMSTLLNNIRNLISGGQQEEQPLLRPN